MSQTEADIPVRIRTREADVRGANRTYVREVRLGRKDECEVQVESGVVSRVHARIVFEGGRWWIVDENSTNGTYLDGEEIDRAPLPAEAEVQLGEDGPTFRLQRPAAEEEEASASRSGRDESGSYAGATRPEMSSTQSEPSREAEAEVGSDRPDASVTQYVRHYFEDDDRPAGEHTRMLRQAYQRAQRKERRQYLWIVAGVLVLCVLLGGYAVWQHLRLQQLRERAQKMAASQRALDARIAKFRQSIVDSGGTSVQEQLAELKKQRREQEERYNGFVRELGIRRGLTAKEEEIYDVARIFGESEVGIPAGFVRKVKEKIDTYWKSPNGRSRLVDAIQRAEQQGYTGFIVRTMREHSLPPEFFYLALQESDFDVNTVGPRTRHGIAKGMWQFIPSTAREYGLYPGPRKDKPVVDFQDERHDFKKSTRAAARYLRNIYSTKAQASGLLVIASYNWGEHRVTDKLEHLPKGIPEKALEGIPQDPDKRNYWRFLKEYDARMPEQTKDYVLKVFSAAVIGRNPRLFGFDFENPLQEHLTASSIPMAEPSGTSDEDHEPSTPDYSK